MGKGYFSPLAFAISIAGHVVLLAVMFSFGSSKPAVEEAQKPAEAESAESGEERQAEREPAGRATAVDEESPKPIVDERPKPVVENRNVPEKNPIPAPVVARDKKKPAERADEPKEPEAPRRSVIAYTVKKGDSLTALAKRSSCTMTELAKLNGKSVKALSNLRIGQKIKLPKAD